MSPDDENPYRLAEAAVSRAIGVRIDETLAGRIRQRVAAMAEGKGRSPLDLLRDPVERPSVDAVLIEAATVQESWWFRDPAQFAALESIVEELGEVGTIWCAGCAHGQEPYSLAMALEELGLARWRILATDVDGSALAQTRAGAYTERQLRGLSAVRKQRFLRPSQSRWVVRDEVRQRVSVLRHNLATDGPPLGGHWPVVFCRNVLMYLDDPARQAAINTLAAAIAPRGWLFLGTAESVWRLHPDLELAPVGQTTAHRGVDPAGHRGVDPAAHRGVDPAAHRGVAPTARQRPEDHPVPSGTRRVAFSAHSAVAFGGHSAVAFGGRSAAQPRPVRAGHREADHGPLAAELSDRRARGLAALGEGDLRLAIAELRKVAYLSVSDAVDHFHLALALEEAGHDRAAGRAYRAALATLSSTDAGRLEGALEGYGPGALEALLHDKVDGR